MKTKSPKLINKAIDRAQERVQKNRQILRRNRQAYIGMHGVAYDAAQDQIVKLRESRKTLCSTLVEKGETVSERAGNLVGGVKSQTEKTVQSNKKTLWSLMPGAMINRTEELEAELKDTKAKLAALKKTAPKKTTKKKAKKKAVKTRASATPFKTETPAPLQAAPIQASVQTDEAPVVIAEPALTQAAPAHPAVKVEPRHIPYFEDVKRYDPYANEDIVRKIVNHCGIALRNDDARYVACSDEAERNRVRDSWLKKKLETAGTDADLNKKVQNVCSIMQRDNKKNRVTFYYLIAKAERKLDTL